MLDMILKPRSIAVVGASRAPNTIGHQILANLVQRRFTGAVFPVNPKATSVGSIRAVPTVGAIGEPLDLAVIVVPKERVAGVVEECGEAGVRGLVVISAGFREVGGAGVDRELAVMEIVRRYGMRMVGPNCMGVINGDPAVSMNATFAPVMPPYGPAAFVSQSGALGLSVLDYASEYGIGIGQFVSVGNKPDVSGNDLLLQWENDPTVETILMYVENFGNPRTFLEIASRITRRKPIIALKSGRSSSGARAAASHTGALAASDETIDALLSQAGVLRARSMEELFDITMAFGAQPLPRSQRTAVITNAGGPGILVADALEAHGIVVPELDATTVATLSPLLPGEASLRNPLDMIAAATPSSYRSALSAVLADPGIHAAVAIFVPPLGIRQADVAEAIVAAAREHPRKPVLAVLMGRDGLPAGRAELRAAGIPAYIFPESAARALRALNRHREWLDRPVLPWVPLPADRERAEAIIAGARATGRSKLDEIEALELIAAYGIPVASARLATSGADAARIAGELGFPVVLKIVSPDIVHKSDVHGIVTGVASAAETEAGYAGILKSVRRAAPDAAVSGILVQRMVRGGRELIAGVTRDRLFGPLVMFGLGGIYVEALRDVTFRIAPFGDAEARDMVTGIRGASMLGAVRGQPSVDTNAIVSVLRRISQIAEDFPEITELDVNPLLAFADRAVAVDARVMLGD
jgi:acetyl coenzyme A synthetase (ADP forming)-like protein